ncbi:MAG: DUF1439 domain-containing protein [Sideroxydans sp.]|nr:DUF1439 domain-containing protein [Sideroxydans sp.]
MKNRLLLLSAILAALGLAACAALIPNQYAVPKSKLVNKLQQSFPLQREVGKGLFSVRMNTPVLNLLADKNRVELVGDIAAHSLLMDAVTGQFSVSGSLRYDRAEHAIYMQDAQLDALQISTDAAAAEMLRPFLNTLLREYLNSTPLYRFQTDELRFAGNQIDITAIQIQADAVVLKLQAAQK